MKFGLFTIIALLFLTVFVSPVVAHPGRTDANGGHTCRTNCEKWGLQYGEYHYHNGGGASNESAPVPANVVPEVQSEPTIPTTGPAKRIVLQPTKAPTRVPYKETAYDKKKLFKVTQVVDGDTIKVNIRGKIETVRLLAIDTPETVDPRKPVQCFGREAKAKMKSLVSGKYIKLIDDRSQGNKDKYNRLLRYVYTEDGMFINREMVALGFATSYKQYPTKFLNEFNSLELQAREKDLGLWRTCQ